jgi:DnaJ homolog subfamily C member 25
MRFGLHILLALAVFVIASHAKRAPIFDPFNVFCGEEDCYELLGVHRNADDKTISKAYREMSKTLHPDKVHPDKRENVTEKFRLISKAYEVLKGNESRPNFDFYLDNPRSYFKATGKHAWKALPKLPPFIVVLFAMFVFSGFLHFIQINRHKRAATLLKDQVKIGLGVNKGGTKLSSDLNTKAIKNYESYCKQNGIKLNGSPFTSPAAKEKMTKDPKYDEICGNVLDEIKDWGEYAMPKTSDLFIIKFFTIYPFLFMAWMKTYYRRYLSGQPLSNEDKEEMARDAIGMSTWEALSQQERTNAIDNKLWESEAYDAWLAKREGATEISKRQQKKIKKNAKYGGGGEMQQDPTMMRDLTE